MGRPMPRVLVVESKMANCDIEPCLILSCFVMCYMRLDERTADKLWDQLHGGGAGKEMKRLRILGAKQ